MTDMIVYASCQYKPRRKSKKSTVATKQRKVSRFVEMTAKPEPYRAPSHSHIKSATVEAIDYSNRAPVYEGEMLDREMAAREEIAHKAKCVAPAYNKGAYQYIATEEQAKWIGKK